MNQVIWLGIGLGMMMMSVGVIYYTRRQLVKIIGQIDAQIDNLTNGNKIDAELNDETLTSKVFLKLKRLSEMLVAQQTASQQQHQQIQQLIADISHQVKTPIANIKMLNDTLLEQPLAENNRQEMQRQLTGQVNKLAELVQGMLKASQLETGAVVVQPSEQLLLGTLGQAVSDIGVQAEKRSIEIHVECPEVIVKHDPKWTAEAFFNLLDNAVKYTPVGGTIQIVCQPLELYTRISITDTGMGISEDEQAQVFQRFYRSPSVSQIEGVGIGLFLTNQIIQQQGGYLRMTSEVGAGTTLDVFLPNH